MMSIAFFYKVVSRTYDAIRDERGNDYKMSEEFFSEFFFFVQVFVPNHLLQVRKYVENIRLFHLVSIRVVCATQ